MFFRKISGTDNVLVIVNTNDQMINYFIITELKKAGSYEALSV